MEEPIYKQLNMTKEEFEASIRGFSKELEEEYKSKVTSMYEQRHSLLPALLKYMKENGSIDDESISYFPEKYPFTAKQFNDFFSSCTDYIHGAVGYCIDEECHFENRSYWMEYEGAILEFFVMYGQGTFTCLKVVDDNMDVPAEMIASGAGWIDFIEEKYASIR